MADHASHDHGTHDHSHSAAAPFSQAEIRELQSDDISAARAVVVLMLGIFGMGVFIYSVVAFWVVNYS